jgi:predicted  nucleic acid-binding Zn-ribbon protein
MSLKERLSKIEKYLSHLQQEHRTLQEKNTLAKKKIEQILGQLTKMEVPHE